jgi:sulfur carrier protein
MSISVNGEPRADLAPGATVADALDALGVAAPRRGMAVAVDGEVVPRGAWERHTLSDGARVEVVDAIQGG